LNDQTGATTTQVRGKAGRRSGFARFAAVGGIIAAVALVALLMFSGDGGYKVEAVFENAGQLVKGNQVQVGGRPVGTITDIELNDSSQAVVEMEVEDDIAPLHEGTTATIRATSLSGIANRYVSLDPGPNDAGEVEDGGRIGADATTAPVDLDQLFNTLDPDTRKGLQQFVQGSATYYGGRSKEASESLKYFAPALSATSRLTREIVLDEAVFERFVTDTSRLVGAVAERRGDLAALVGNANTTARAIGDENIALARALDLLPGTFRKANSTFVNLRAALDDVDVLVAESKPATKDLAPFLRALRPLVTDSRPTIHDLRELIRKRGKNNDLIELTSKMPKLANQTKTVFPRAIRAFNRADPVIEYARFYTPDLAGWFTKFAESANAYDANGHYARIQPIFSPFSLTDLPEPLGDVLSPLGPGQNRLSSWSTGNFRRCPGGAMQPPPDGSAPRAVSECDPNSTP
jgi:phospholipid/cholesterol/gamma-HCH transport system substrate-binding protein